MVERKYYDLTPSQKLMYFALKFIPQKNVVNIGTAVWFHENIDCELLKAAAYKAIWRMDALRLRLKKVKGEIKQYVSEEEPKEIKIEDYSNYSKDHIDEILEKWTSTPFKYNDKELYDVSIIKGPENVTGLYIKVNHVVRDAWGLTVYAKDVINIYLAMKEGKELPEEPAKFVPLIEKDLEYMNSKRMQQDYESIKEKWKTPAVFASVEPKYVGKKYRPNNIRYKGKQKVMSLDKSIVAKINEYCRENRISQQTLFILGSQIYFYKLNNTDKSMVNSVLARRSSMDRKRAGGMMVNNLQLKVECPYGLSFKEACEKLTKEQFELYRHGDFPYQLAHDYVLKQAGVKSGVLTDFTITYQPAKIFTDNRIKATVENYFNGSASMNLYLTIMDTLDSGELDFMFQYKVAVVSDEIVDELYRVMIKAVEIGIECPTKTIGEIIDEIYA